MLSSFQVLQPALLIPYFFSNYPSTAKFLSEPERAFINTRLKSSSDATNDEKFSWVNVHAALADYK